MNPNSPFINWFYNGPIGWPLFAIIALAAILWLNLDSLRRHLPIGRWWRLAVILPILLLLPIIIFQFANTLSQRVMRGYNLLIVGSGVLAGLIPAIAAVAYTLRFWGLVVCPKGHPPYPKSKEMCPVCARQTIPGMPGYESSVAPGGPGVATKSGRKKVKAWVITGKGFSFQLYEGDTIIGRYDESDIRLNDAAISRIHAKIVEEKGHFLLYDFGSTTGTWLNGNRVRHPEPLKDGDVINLADGTHLIFTIDPSQVEAKAKGS
jgi:hypothetical protein